MYICTEECYVSCVTSTGLKYYQLCTSALPEVLITTHHHMYLHDL